MSTVMKYYLTWQKQKLKITGKRPSAKFQNAKIDVGKDS